MLKVCDQFKPSRVVVFIVFFGLCTSSSEMKNFVFDVFNLIWSEIHYERFNTRESECGKLKRLLLQNKWKPIRI